MAIFDADPGRRRRGRGRPQAPRLHRASRPASPEPIGSFTPDPSIPLPVETGGARKQSSALRFDRAPSPPRPSSPACSRLLAWRPDHEKAGYYRAFVKAVRPEILAELSEAGIAKARNKDWEIAEEIFRALAGLYPEAPEPLLDLAILSEDRAELYSQIGARGPGRGDGRARLRRLQAPPRPRAALPAGLLQRGLLLPAQSQLRSRRLPPRDLRQGRRGRREEGPRQGSPRASSASRDTSTTSSRKPSTSSAWARRRRASPRRGSSSSAIPRYGTAGSSSAGPSAGSADGKRDGRPSRRPWPSGPRTSIPSTSCRSAFSSSEGSRRPGGPSSAPSGWSPRTSRSSSTWAPSPSGRTGSARRRASSARPSISTRATPPPRAGSSGSNRRQ